MSTRAHGIKNNIIWTKLLCWTIYFEWRVIKVVCSAYSENRSLAFISALTGGTAGWRITEQPPSQYYIIVATANNIILLYRNGSRDTYPLVVGGYTIFFNEFSTKYFSDQKLISSIQSRFFEINLKKKRFGIILTLTTVVYRYSPSPAGVKDIA